MQSKLYIDDRSSNLTPVCEERNGRIRFYRRTDYDSFHKIGPRSKWEPGPVPEWFTLRTTILYCRLRGPDFLKRCP